MLKTVQHIYYVRFHIVKDIVFDNCLLMFEKDNIYLLPLGKLHFLLNYLKIL